MGLGEGPSSACAASLPTRGRPRSVPDARFLASTQRGHPRTFSSNCSVRNVGAVDVQALSWWEPWMMGSSGL